MGNTLDLNKPIHIKLYQNRSVLKLESSFIGKLRRLIKNGDFTRYIVGFEGWAIVKGPRGNDPTIVDVTYRIDRKISKSNYVSFLITRLRALSWVDAQRTQVYQD